jgi:hypothetical protein
MTGPPRNYCYPRDSFSIRLPRLRPNQASGSPRLIFTFLQGKEGVRVSKGDSRRDVLLVGARSCACEGQAASQNRQSEETITASRFQPFGRLALVLLTIVFSVTTAAHLDLARAGDCLAAPNSAAPKGSHWYYHLNRATQQKCWYIRSVERRRQDVTVQTSSPDAAMPQTNGSRVARPRDIGSPAQRPEQVIPAREESASGTVPTMQVAAAGPEIPLSEGEPRPTAPTTIWPDPPPIQPLVKAEGAGATPASPDPAYSVADASESISKKDEQTSRFDIPIGLFPAFAFGLVVLGFAYRFLTKRAAARRVREDEHTEATTSIDQYAKPAGNGVANYAANDVEDDFDSFISAVSGDGPLEQIIRSGRSADDIEVQEAKLAQLRHDIGQRLGWAEPGPQLINS